MTARITLAVMVAGVAVGRVTHASHLKQGGWVPYRTEPLCLNAASGRR